MRRCTYRYIGGRLDLPWPSGDDRVDVRRDCVWIAEPASAGHQLRQGRVQFLDATGECCLERIVRKLQQQGVLVLVSELGAQPRQIMSRGGLCEQIGEDHIFEHTGDAICLALTRMDSHRCRGCLHDSFWECRQYTS